ncbi:hypothetical protein KC959_00715, partial [Candidatus Saccharibacteria bacterium]|nr:hypothetical protein [Candidatus Saccharibacteria bacterium]
MSELLKIKGIGENTEKLLGKLGLRTPLDLVANIPRAFDDYSHVQAVRSIRPGPVTVKVRFSNIRGRYSKKGLHITEALASDETGSVKVMWFNQPYRAQSLKAEEEYYVSGDFAQNFRYLVISNPTCELVSSFPLHTARLVPIYRLTKGLSAHQLRRFTKEAFNHVDVTETLPSWLREEKELMNLSEALMTMHFPETLDDLVKAKRRLGFEELFTMSLASELNKHDFAKEKALHIPFNEKIVINFVKSLPFELTSD